MRPTFMGFEAAKSAIFTNQKSLDIVGNNLSNVNTAGYTRQNVDRGTVSSASYSSRTNSNSIGLQGQGVTALGVGQTRDSFLDKCFREEYGNASFHGQTAAILGSVQGALGDGADITDESGLMGAMTNIYESLNEFMKEPTMDSQANLVMSSFKNMAQVLQQMDANLTNVTKQYTEDLEVDVARINDITAQIAHLNGIISKDPTVLSDPENEHYGPNDLLDQRNLLIDELSSYGDVSVTELANGEVDITFGEDVIVSGGESEDIQLTKNQDGTVLLKWKSSGAAIDTQSGTLVASIQYLNGRGNNVQSSSEEPFQGIPYYRDQLNTFASAFANMANNTLPELGENGEPAVDADGNIIYKTLMGGKTPDGTTSPYDVTADNISISDEWNSNGPGYFIFNEDERVEDYAQQMASQLTDTSYTFVSHGETFEGTFADFHINMLSTLGADVNFHQGRQESYAQVSNSFLDGRDAVSGVNSDEETSDMLKYQKSYEAAARMMTVMDELLEVIVNLGM